MLTFKQLREALVIKAKSYDNDDEVGTRYRHIGTGSHLEKNLAKIHKIPLSKITTHEPLEKTHKDTADTHSERNVQGMVKTLKGKGSLEPVLLVKHENGYKLLDGHHRLEAHKRMGRTHIAANILDKRHWKNDETK